jgi:hypothetical protein
MEDIIVLKDFVFWNKVDEDKLTIEMKKDDKRIILRIYTNDVNILNKKIELNENSEKIIDIKIRRILDMVEKISNNRLGGNTEEYQQLSGELMQEIQKL